MTSASRPPTTGQLGRHALWRTIGEHAGPRINCAKHWFEGKRDPRESGQIVHGPFLLSESGVASHTEHTAHVRERLIRKESGADAFSTQPCSVWSKIAHLLHQLQGTLQVKSEQSENVT